MSSASDKKARADDANGQRGARIAANTAEWERGMVEGIGSVASLVSNEADRRKVIRYMWKRFPELAAREIDKRDL